MDYTDTTTYPMDYTLTLPPTQWTTLCDTATYPMDYSVTVTYPMDYAVTLPPAQWTLIHHLYCSPLHGWWYQSVVHLVGGRFSVVHWVGGSIRV